MKKLLLFSLFSFALYPSQDQTIALRYMNDKIINFQTILTGDCATSIDYNIINDGNGAIGGAIRLYGIHNMSINVEGYETIDLVKDDVCLRPYLFTILALLFSDQNFLVQRWACVKWFMPLTFGFKLNNNNLTIWSSITKYKFLSPLRAKEIIELQQNSLFDATTPDNKRQITVSINGRSATVCDKTSVAIYSASSLTPPAILARCLFL